MKIKSILILGIVLSVALSGNAQAETFIGTILKDQQITTVQNYTEWLTDHISYRSDGGSREWADPQTTIKRGYGDCKDYALLNREALKHFGYESKIYSVTQFNQDKHAIVVFKTGGRYAFFSNDELYLTDALTEDDFRKYLASQHEYFSPQLIS